MGKMSTNGCSGHSLQEIQDREYYTTPGSDRESF